MAAGGSLEVEKKLLRLLHDRKSRTQLAQIHAHFLRHHLCHSNQLLSHFVSICGSLHKMHYARLVFQQSSNPNIFLFNSMIKGYSLCGPFGESLSTFSAMKRRGIWPNELTFAPLLKACSNLQDLKLGRGIHKEILMLGYEGFGSIRTGIVELYTGFGKMRDARIIFDEMSHRDVIVWNLMIQGYAKSGEVDRGYSLFRRMGERSIVSWNLMISCLSQGRRYREGLKLFHEMQECGFDPDEATVVTVLPICAQLGEIDIGRWIHSYVMSNGLYQSSVSVGTSLIDLYCKCGELEKAFSIFREMTRKNVVTWNAMISGLAFNGKGELGVQLFKEMIDKGVTPNDSTFVGVLTCCGHDGLVQRGRDLFASMTMDHHITPKREHYGCMVDLLARNGCTKEAFDLIHTMPMTPNAALWGALLSACCTHSDTELAEYAVKELIQLEPSNSGNYVLLSNIYAERGSWDEVEKVRVIMREKSINKAPGQSMVG